MAEGQNANAMAEGLKALLPPGYAKTVGFLIPTPEMSDELIEWYETKHSVYASFMWPHMRRYQRNYIMNVKRGPVPLYKVVSEFVWKSEEDKRRIVALYSTEAAAKTVNEVLPAFVVTPFPPNSFFLTPVCSRMMATSARSFRHDEPRRRQVMLGRCRRGEAPASFEAAMQAYAEELSRNFQGAEVSLDFRREAATVPAPADAVLYVDAEPGMTLPDPDIDVCDIVNIFDVVTLRSPIEEG